MTIIAIIAFIAAWPILMGLAAIALLGVLLYTEHEFVASAILVAAVGFLMYGFTESGVAINWALFGECLAGYVVFGLAFTWVKWIFWSSKMGRKFAAVKKDYDANPRNYPAKYDSSKSELFDDVWNSRFSKGVMKVRMTEDGSRVDTCYFDKPVLVGYLTSWILNWPIYGVLLVLEDFIAEMVNIFADKVGKSFQRIATRAFNTNLANAG